MKILRYIFTVVIICLSFSCDDKFLEEHPKSLYIMGNAFEKSSQVEDQLTMCYIRLYNWYGKTSNPWVSTYEYKSFGTDVLDVPYWRHDGAGGYSNFGTWNTTSAHVELMWNELYQVISYANLALLGCELENITWSTEENRKNIMAEAYFFRGFAYLRLAEAWGGVPLVTEFEETVRYDHVRATREQTYQYAVENLLEAYKGLPDYPMVDGRLGKGAAAHLLSEAYLALGVETGNNANYPQAIEYAQKAIALHPLMNARFGVRANPMDLSQNRNCYTYFPQGNVYSDLFYPGNYDRSMGNTESIWVFQTPTYEQADETGGQSGMEPFFFSFVARDLNWAAEYVEAGAAAGPWKAIAPEYNTANFPAFLGGFGIAEAKATDYAFFDVWTDPTDYRYQEDVTVRTTFTCTDPNHSMFRQKVSAEMLDQNPTNLSKFFPIFSKIIPLDEWPYRDTDKQHQGYSHDNYAIRSAETYLLLAEAYLRNEQKELAVEAVNVVRRRANCSIMYVVDDFDIHSILDERIRECLYEEGRWFTLLRMEPTVWKKRIYDHGMFTADYPKYTLSIEWNLWPIPQSIIDLNSDADIVQNPGWE